MTRTPNILAFAGSTRKDSFNKKLVKIAAEGARGAEVTFLDLRDFPLPLYDGDLEEEKGLPENAIRLKEIMKAHQGLLISAPEHNGSITAVLKNTIDWLSRPMEGEKLLDAFTGKTAALMSASPGGFGGLRGLVHVRAILGNLGILVLPDQIAVSRAHEAFADDGSLKDEKLDGSVRNLGEKLTDTLVKLL
jgi:NAD(P)H-dependent FMN reductase